MHFLQDVFPVTAIGLHLFWDNLYYGLIFPHAEKYTKIHDELTAIYLLPEQT